MHVSRLSLLSILAVMISACQPPSAKELTVLASDTVEAVIEQVQSDDTAVQETVAENTSTDAIAEDDQTEEDAEITVASIPEDVQAPPSLDPYSLIGTPLSDLVGRLGEPDYIRIDADVEIYQYRLVHCVVDFVALRDPFLLNAPSHLSMRATAKWGRPMTIFHVGLILAGQTKSPGMLINFCLMAIHAFFGDNAITAFLVYGQHKCIGHVRSASDALVF